jgi:hypothetical protein
MSDLLNSASLVMIPSGYKEDIVYSAVPTDGSGDLSFTRASNGTRVNSAGLVEDTPWNLVEQSETFDNAYWQKANVTVSANATTAPNGTATADKIISSAVNDEHLIYYFESTYVNQVVTLSAYVKKADYRYAIIRSYTNGNYQISVFDLDNGVVEGQVLGASTIESVGNGWYRISTTFTTPAGTFGVQYGFSATPTYSYLGNGTSGNFLWGAQLNQGSTAKPYFPTTDRLNVPRLTYQNGGGGCPSLLLEKQSTNLALYSEDFSIGWTQANITITANNTTSPDGTQNADKIEASGSGSVSHSVRQFISTTSGSVYALSLYAKKGTADWIMIRHDNGGTLNYFNLNTGAKGTADASATITSVGNGWYRIVVYHTGTGSNGPEIYIATSDGGNEFTANGQNIYIWGAQYEASSYPTSYIPTTSASATRVADFTSRSGLALTNFTFSVNFKPLDYIVELFDFQKTGGGRMFYVAVQSSGFITFNSVSGGTIGAIGSIIPKLQTCKLAFKLNASTSDLTVFINGSNIGTYTTDITTFGQFLGLQSFGYNPGTQIEQIAIFPSVLTDAECISLTTI